MTGNNHLIQKVTLEIGLPEQEGAYEIQNRLSHAFSTEIVSRLENLFDQYAGADVFITIDRLELDLGKVTLKQLEADFMEVVQKKMEEFLQHTRQEIANATTLDRAASAHLGLTIRWNTSNAKSPDVQITRSIRTLTVLDKVCHLLVHGTLPASHRELSGQRLSVLVDEILSSHADDFIIHLKSIMSPAVLQRLVLNLTESQLQYIASLSGCTFSGQLKSVATQLSALLNLLPRLKATRSLPAGIVLPDTTKIIWWNILNAYLVDDHHRLSRIATEESPFVTQLLLNIIISDQYNVSSPRKIEEIISGLSQKTAAGTQSLCRELSQERNSKKAQTILLEIVRSIKPAEQSAPKVKKQAALVKHENIFHGIPEEQQIIAPFTGEEQPADHSLYITNAGLILLAPYLHHFFLRTGLLDKSTFSSTESAWKAVHLLQNFCGEWSDRTEEDKNAGWSESDLLFNKILCGLPINEPVPEHYTLSAADLEESVALLNSVRTNWTVMRNTSIATLQQIFLQKKGRLVQVDHNWELIIERDSAVEILIERLPWSISMVKLPWNNYIIATQW